MTRATTLWLRLARYSILNFLHLGPERGTNSTPLNFQFSQLVDRVCFAESSGLQYNLLKYFLFPCGSFPPFFCRTRRACTLYIIVNLPPGSIKPEQTEPARLYLSQPSSLVGRRRFHSNFRVLSKFYRCIRIKCPSCTFVGCSVCSVFIVYPKALVGACGVHSFDWW